MATLRKNRPSPYLELKGISRSFGHVIALHEIDFAVGKAEVIGLVGANGAGKSTLMKILGGVFAPSGGKIFLDGQLTTFKDVNHSMRAGIAFVHQELHSFDNLSVAANVLLGRELRRGPFGVMIDFQACAKRAQIYLDRLDANLTANQMVSELSIAERQLVEIAKALSQNARLVIMDEPTSSLTLKEAEKLLEAVLNLKKSGVSVIFISHRLTEVEKIADRVVVLRDGKIAGTLGEKDISAPNIIGLMIGSSLNTIYRAPKNTGKDTLLELRSVCTSTYPNKAVSLTVNRGEILGLTGLIGSGRTEIARAIFGIDTLIAGEILLDGKPIYVRTTADAMRAGLALIPEDRKQSGLLLDESIVENAALPNWPQFSRQNVVDVRKLKRHVDKQMQNFSIKAENMEAYVSSLSGGNQQKVVLAKWLPRSPSVLICDEPTRGVDVGSRQEIYAKLRSVSDEGAAVLLISSDMEEVLGVSDRIAVMHEGGISGIIERKEFSERAVMELATNRNAAGAIV